jgi:hypothetical protein
VRHSFNSTSSSQHQQQQQQAAATTSSTPRATTTSRTSGGGGAPGPQHRRSFQLKPRGSSFSSFRSDGAASANTLGPANRRHTSASENSAHSGLLANLIANNDASEITNSGAHVYTSTPATGNTSAVSSVTGSTPSSRQTSLSVSSNRPSSFNYTANPGGSRQTSVSEYKSNDLFLYEPSSTGTPGGHVSDEVYSPMSLSPPLEASSSVSPKEGNSAAHSPPSAANSNLGSRPNSWNSNSNKSPGARAIMPPASTLGTLTSVVEDEDGHEGDRESDASHRLTATSESYRASNAIRTTIETEKKEDEEDENNDIVDSRVSFGVAIVKDRT